MRVGFVQHYARHGERIVVLAKPGPVSGFFRSVVAVGTRTMSKTFEFSLSLHDEAKPRAEKREQIRANLS